MMKKFFVIVLALSLCIGCLSLAALADDDEIVETPEVVEMTPDEFLAMAEDGAIELTEDVTVTGCISLTEDTVINGNGHTLTSTGGTTGIAAGSFRLALSDITIEKTHTTNCVHWGVSLRNGSLHNVTLAVKCAGIYVDSSDIESDSVSITGCTFNASIGDNRGIYTEEPGEGRVRNLTISGCTFDCKRASVVYGGNIRILNNIVNGSKGFTIFGNVTPCTVTGNIFHGRLDLYPGADVIAHSNVFADGGNIELENGDYNSELINLGGNYWGGEAPALGTTVKGRDDALDCFTLTHYFTEYENGEFSHAVCFGVEHNCDENDAVTCFDETTVTVPCKRVFEDGCVCAETEDVPSKPRGYHTWGDWTEDEGEGTHTRICTICNEATENGEHSFGEWVKDEDAGTQTRTCADCGATETAEIQKPNNRPNNRPIYIPVITEGENTEEPSEETELPEEETPLTETPAEEEAPAQEEILTEIPAEKVPLASSPVMELPDDDVPLADAPRTGDSTALWIAVALLSGLAVIALLPKKQIEK